MTDIESLSPRNEQTVPAAAVLDRLPPERKGVPATADLLEKRMQFAASEPDGSVALTRTALGSVPCRIVDGGDHVAVLYLHGGGYRMGSAAAYTSYGSQLAQAAGAEVVLADYRLAPEAPFPAALRDALAVYHALRTHRPDRPIVVAGDSAGGGLAAAVALAAMRAGITGPDGLALLSPWLDLRCDSTSYASATDPLFDHHTALTAREAYLQGHDDADPLVSPLRVPYPEVFPPSLVQVGTAESLLGDSLAFVDLLATAGVSCQLQTFSGRGHTWPLIEPTHPDSKVAITTLGAFVRQAADAARRRAK
ncbi:alpha/beta hydrolase fold domain-containing protein [Rhodococcus hoagii]|nr:alpha/beta hydrolase fold domain-containing protein [Prescottella equi]